MRAFCDISYGFQATPFQARKTNYEGKIEMLLCFFRQPEQLFKKLSPVPRQHLCGEYTRKTGLTDAHNFEKLAAKN